MITRGVFVLISLSVILACHISAQVDSLWVRGYPGTQLYGGDMVGDTAGNVYVAGRSFDNFGDFLVVKYDASGVFQWARTFDGAGGAQDQPNAIALDPSGNVIVTGYTYSGPATGHDYCTIKYAPNGDTLWIKIHNGFPPSTSDDIATAMVADDSGNVYVTGYGPGPNSAVDVFTIKYSPNGDSLWGQYYNFPATDGGDHGWAITLDDSNNVIVAGDSWGGVQIQPGTNYDYLVLKYSSGGTLLSVRRQQASPAPGSDVARAVTVDPVGNIYVTGYAQEGAWYIATFRFTPGTDSVWQQNYTASGLQGKKIALDGAGNLFVAGDTYDPNYLLIKYSTTGVFQWAREYNAGPTDMVFDMGVDANSDVYVTGASSGTFDGAYVTIKYNTDGDTLWIKVHDFVGGDDVPQAMHVFSPGEFVVSGSGLGQGQIVTVRYSEMPVSVREQFQDGIPARFALDQNYPNPFNPTTTIRFALPKAGHVTLKVFNLLGKEIAALVDGERTAGTYTVEWKPENLSSGVYYYRLHSAGFVATRKLVLMK